MIRSNNEEKTKAKILKITHYAEKIKEGAEKEMEALHTTTKN